MRHLRKVRFNLPRTKNLLRDLRLPKGSKKGALLRVPALRSHQTATLRFLLGTHHWNWIEPYCLLIPPSGISSRKKLVL